MDLKLHQAEPTSEERQAIDALLGPPSSQWDGGERGDIRDAHVAYGGRAQREKRHLLLPALRALQARVGWVSEGGLEYVCVRLGIPPADAWGVATFYALLSTAPRPKRVLHVCDDIVCRCRGANDVIAELEKEFGPAFAHSQNGGHLHVDPDKPIWMKSPCLGMCERAPAAFLQQAGPAPRELLFGATPESAVSVLNGGTPTHAPRPPADRPGRGPLLARVGTVDPDSIEAYRASGGFKALEKALSIGAEAVIREVTESRLMGRGGAAFPTGRKWDAVAKQPARPRYMICNADESEPGTFKDRVLMELDPFAIIEAMAIASFATGCENAFIYVRGEYALATRRLQQAIDASRKAGYLGSNVLGRGVRVEIEIRQGGGAYICGEETAIFNSIEGYRGEPRNKPPFPVQAGLFGLPTLVNNVETLANIPRIVLEGGAAFARVGTEQSTGTRLFCLSGHVKQPGVYEVPFGRTLRDLLDMAGGVSGSGKLRAILLGGAAGVFVRPDELDIPLTFEGARAAKATLGSGVIVAFDDTTDLTDVLLRIASFFRDESCGQCVPCRVGTVRQEEALHRIAARKTLDGVPGEVALMDEVGAGMRDASICGLGQTAYSAVESAIHRLKLYDGVTA